MDRSMVIAGIDLHARCPISPVTLKAIKPPLADLSYVVPQPVFAALHCTAHTCCARMTNLIALLCPSCISR